MARLNEPPASADSLETLRRRFLRQNRDIARVNSNQSLRIRSLENECARLLSENLDLRGQVLRMEKELENNSASRVADHALEIKARMELQLLEMSSLLECLGLEPPTKRRSSNRERKMAKPRPSLFRSPPARRQRNPSVEEQDALAMQEGRMPPIHENKSYPRQTLSREEILALCSEAETSTDSPDLGPPPVSRFVEEDPVKTDSPTRALRLRVYSDAPLAAEAGSPLALNGQRSAQSPLPSPTKKVASPQPAKTESPRLILAEKPLAFDKPIATDKALTPRKALTSQKPLMADKPLTIETPLTLEKSPLATENVPAKSSSKRKFAVTDENEISNFAKSENEKPAGAREGKGKRSARGVSGTGRKDARPRALGVAPMARPALAAKSTNDDLMSPRKQPPTKAPMEAMEMAKPTPNLQSRPRDTHKASPPSIMLDLPNPSPPPVAEIHPSELAAASLDTQMMSPITPGRPSVLEKPCDTPPPLDISSAGDIARPSRRARAAVSYAEPSLRDKMRRPTKELTDAVSGEGKYKHRASINTKEETVSMIPSSATKGRATPVPPVASTERPVESVTMQRSPGVQSAAPLEVTGREPVTSPSARRMAAPSDVPNVNITSRRKQASTAGQSDGASSRADTRPEPTTNDLSSAKDVHQSNASAPMLDPYEFTTTSPAVERTTTVERASAPMRNSHARSSRRPVLREDVAAALKGEVAAAATQKTTRSAGSRKRASLATRNKPSMLEGRDDSEDDYGDSEAATDTSDRLSRRRSMMI
ncbi:hypothetical protein GGTG_06794 [Gaeumannomyces tritici R3-111a-1]|uniref:Shugoshin n=1 Tax=Gaeumannomyces tritici (strain R3-111a-1) TaxID=644352 RepID=J3NZU7_GAET3|nr:hypothetical protein GGTG_06794 [Gaeumannomyces tritici R3-111a-1]EJT76880.1 hypothetical protein GGTG_06794 [Gaeumannomyces tritici R3-111a-1]